MSENKYNIPSYLKKFDEQEFKDYYAKYEQYLYKKKSIKCRIVAPIENFDFDYTSKPSVINLFSGVRIVPANSTFYHEIKEANIVGLIGEVVPNIGDYDIPEFFLEIDRMISRKTFLSDYKKDIKNTAKKKLEEVMKILRLYKKGDLRCGFIYWYPETPCDAPHSYTDMLLFYGNDSTSNQYSLQEGEVESLRRLFAKYSNLSDNEHFPKMAINNFNEGLEDDKPKNKLLSFLRALESLLGKDKSDDSNLLRRRTAKFITKEQQERIYISNDIEFAYKYRSTKNIAHGSQEDVYDESECKKHADKTERYVRQAINNWLDEIKEGKTAKDIIRSIDDDQSF